MTFNRRDFMASAAALSAGAALPVQAQSLLHKPVRLIVPNSPASGIDVMARLVSQALAVEIGQPVVVENLPGAGGMTGTSVLVRAPADGSAIAMVSNNHVINPAVYKKIPFDALADITPICWIGESPLVVLVHPDVKASNLAELRALMQKDPGSLNYASSGNGSIYHLAVEFMLDQAQLKATHVPYRGTGPMLTGIVSGQVHFGISGMSSATPHLKNGLLRAIGICSRERVASHANIATLAEQGLPNFEISAWFGIIGPAGMDPQVVNRLNAAVSKVYTSPEITASLEQKGTIPRPASVADTAKYFRSETLKYAALAKKISIQID